MDVILEPEIAEAPSGNDAGHFATRFDGGAWDVPDGYTIEAFRDILSRCTELRASDVTFESGKLVRAEIGGRNHDVTTRPVGDDELDTLIRRIYGDHATGVLKGGHDIDTSYEIRLPDRTLRNRIRRYRVNVTTIRMPGGDGKQMTIRTIASIPVPLADLALEKDILDNIRPRQGMVLITGPTGSGKSTLAAAIVAHIASDPNRHEKILTYESPIEYVYDTIDKPTSSVAQTEVGRHLRPRDGDETEKSLFAYAVRNALRRKPTIGVIGETRDLATMEASMEFATTGHLLYSTLHSNGVPATLQRCVKFFPALQQEGAASDMMETLRMIVTQLLFDRKGGGKIALREYMIFDEKTRRAFLKRPPSEWPAHARRMLIEKQAKGQLMRDAAWKAYSAGHLDRDAYMDIVRAEEHSA